LGDDEGDLDGEREFVGGELGAIEGEAEGSILKIDGYELGWIDGIEVGLVGLSVVIIVGKIVGRSLSSPVCSLRNQP
jgi:hypothetical protein